MAYSNCPKTSGSTVAREFVGLFCNKQICNGRIVCSVRTSGSVFFFLWLSWKVAFCFSIILVQTANMVITQGLTCSQRFSFFRMEIGHQSLGSHPNSQRFIQQAESLEKEWLRHQHKAFGVVLFCTLDPISSLTCYLKCIPLSFVFVWTSFLYSTTSK